MLWKLSLRWSRFLHTRQLLLRRVLRAHVQKCALERTNPTSASISRLDQRFYLYGSNRCIATSHYRCTNILDHLKGLTQSPAQGIAVLQSLCQRVSASSVGGIDTSDDPPAERLDASCEPPVSSAFYINDDHVSSILKNPLTGEDWFRNSSLNLDW